MDIWITFREKSGKSQAVWKWKVRGNPELIVYVDLDVILFHQR